MAPVAILFGLAAALTYGAADFVGGVATKRAHALSVVVFSQLTGALLLLAALPFFNEQPPSGESIGWGAAGGVAGGIGVVFLYRGLASGRMSVVAPVTGVVAAGVPLLIGLARGERPGPLALIGVVAALVAVVLVSSPGPQSRGSGAGRAATSFELRDAVAAGLGFGAFFVFLDAGGDDPGLWVLVGARLGSLTIVPALALISGRPLLVAREARAAAASAGLLDVSANLFFVLASRVGLLSLVSVLTSMYPATTVLLARVVLNERLHRVQLGGLALAAAGVALIAAG